MTFYAGEGDRHDREAATMLRDPFFKGLRDQLRPLAMWVAGVAFYVALLISIYPSIREERRRHPGVRPEHAGGGAAPPSWAQRLLHPGRLRQRGTALLAGADRAHRVRRRRGARSLAGEEENGTLGLVLTHTVGRRRLVLQKYAAMLVVAVTLGAVFWLSLTVATAIAGTPVGAGDLARPSLRPDAAGSRDRQRHVRRGRRRPGAGSTASPPAPAWASSCTC